MESDTPAAVNGPQRTQQSRENQGPESQPRGADPDGAAISDDMPPGSFDWILNSGIDDPELLTKLRLVSFHQCELQQPFSRGFISAILEVLFFCILLRYWVVPVTKTKVVVVFHYTSYSWLAQAV